MARFEASIDEMLEYLNETDYVNKLRIVHFLNSFGAGLVINDDNEVNINGADNQPTVQEEDAPGGENLLLGAEENDGVEQDVPAPQLNQLRARLIGTEQQLQQTILTIKEQKRTVMHIYLDRILSEIYRSKVLFELLELWPTLNHPSDIEKVEIKVEKRFRNLFHVENSFGLVGRIEGMRVETWNRFSRMFAAVFRWGTNNRIFIDEDLVNNYSIAKSVRGNGIFLRRLRIRRRILLQQIKDLLEEDEDR